jgi:hypothetical protein
MERHPGLCGIVMDEPGEENKRKDNFGDMERYQPQNLKASFWDAWETVLLVRDPWGRFLSHFRMNHRWKKKGLSPVLADLADARTVGTRVNYNMQHLVPGLRANPRECNKADLEHAKKVVDRFSLILNFVDLPAESTLLACAVLGTPPENQINKQVSSVRLRHIIKNNTQKAQDHLGGAPEEEFQAFKKENQCDYDIVTYANQKVSALAHDVRSKGIPPECS